MANSGCGGNGVMPDVGAWAAEEAGRLLELVVEASRDRILLLDEEGVPLIGSGNAGAGAPGTAIADRAREAWLESTIARSAG